MRLCKRHHHLSRRLPKYLLKTSEVGGYQKLFTKVTYISNAEVCSLNAELGDYPSYSLGKHVYYISVLSIVLVSSHPHFLNSKDICHLDGLLLPIVVIMNTSLTIHDLSLSLNSLDRPLQALRSVYTVEASS